MEDDYNASSSWVFVFWRPKVVWIALKESALRFDRLRLDHKYRVQTWLSAGCALAVVCCCISAGTALGQSSTAPTSTTSKSDAAKSTSKTVSPKKYVKAASGSRSNTSGPAAKAHAASHPAAGKHTKSSTVAARNNPARSARKNSKKKTTARGQQKIEPERAQEIQEALIRENYLSGEASGTWNESSEAAMRKYQADHGWQSKTVPDSRALISLGLGPSHEHLLNPESAMTTEAAAPHAASLTPVSHSAEPGARLTTTPGVAPATVPSATPEHDSSEPQ
jgi:hypothetical protein